MLITSSFICDKITAKGQMGIVIIVISSSDNDKLSSPLNFFIQKYAGSQDPNIMKLWRKVGSGFKSNILILITVALWHKVTQSADALAHLISFMS